eukprot:6451367-Heterocapsa_arctica.AAC.1
MSLKSACSTTRCAQPVSINLMMSWYVVVVWLLMSSAGWKAEAMFEIQCPVDSRAVPAAEKRHGGPSTNPIPTSF